MTLLQFVSDNTGFTVICLVIASTLIMKTLDSERALRILELSLLVVTKLVLRPLSFSVGFGLVGGAIGGSLRGFVAGCGSGIILYWLGKWIEERRR